MLIIIIILVKFNSLVLYYIYILINTCQLAIVYYQSYFLDERIKVLFIDVKISNIAEKRLSGFMIRSPVFL